MGIIKHSTGKKGGPPRGAGRHPHISLEKSELEVKRIVMTDEITGDEYYVSIRDGKLSIKPKDLQKHRDNQINTVIDGTTEV